MSPIPSNFFIGSQQEWDEKRFKFIWTLFEKEWFKGKRVLEVACGRGTFGKEFKKLGAEVVFTDARQLFVDDLVENGYTAQMMDQDKPWTVGGPFDLVIHFGVLYHLDDWKQDLRCAIETAPLVLLETEASNVDDPTYERKIKEDSNHYDQAFNANATRFSDTHVEAVLTELGVPFTRYDDPSLDGPFPYSWKRGDNMGGAITRRMWLIGKRGE